MKVWRKTYRAIRLLAALTDELIVVLIQRLVEEETERVKAKEKQC